MDSQCAKMGSHETMMKKEVVKSEKDCTLGCIKIGGKFILFNATAKTVYELDDQQKPMEFAGEKVKVTGTLDKATKTIHVAEIKRASDIFPFKKAGSPHRLYFLATCIA